MTAKHLTLADSVRLANRVAINPERIGSILRNARVAHGLHQREAAIAMGLLRSVLGRMERGVHIATLSTLERACTFYGLPLADLFTVTERDLTLVASEAVHRCASAPGQE